MRDNPKTARSQDYKPKPPWLKKKLVATPCYEQTRTLLRNIGIHTVCQEARCPNLWECFSRRTATFLIMGNCCTRNCRFCAVKSGIPEPPDRDEAKRVARAVLEMKLRYVVITSVTRDDLADGGASCFVDAIEAVRTIAPHAAVEVLIPDFMGSQTALASVLAAKPAVLNHNIETVPRLYRAVRPVANYHRSLDILRRTAEHSGDLPVKTGLMLGLGETMEELRNTLLDIVQTGTRILTLGQYLQPASGEYPVTRFIPPDEFDFWKETALSLGFSAVASGPFVRSSYDAAGLFHLFHQCLPLSSPSRRPYNQKGMP